MPRRTRLALAGIAVTLLLAFTVTNASANRLSFSQTRWRISWASLEFIPMLEPTVRCPVTLEGSFHLATFAKTFGALVGYITRASVGTCTEGTAVALTTTLPWHVLYQGFGGALPRISSISFFVSGLSFELTPTGRAPCLIATGPTEAAIGFLHTVEAEGTLGVREFAWEAPPNIRCRSALIENPTRLRGAGAFQRLGTTNADIQVILIA